MIDYRETTLSRRQALQALGISAAAGLAAACGPSKGPEPTPLPTATLGSVRIEQGAPASASAAIKPAAKSSPQPTIEIPAITELPDHIKLVVSPPNIMRWGNILASRNVKILISDFGEAGVDVKAIIKQGVRARDLPDVENGELRPKDFWLQPGMVFKARLGFTLLHPDESVEKWLARHTRDGRQLRSFADLSNVITDFIANEINLKGQAPEILTVPSASPLQTYRWK